MRATISRAGTTRSAAQWFVLPTSMNSMNRRGWPRSRKYAASAGSSPSFTPRCTTQFTFTGKPAAEADLRRVCEAIADVPVLANTGVNLDNVKTVMSLASGAIVGTHFKVDGNTWNAVDGDRVKRFMDVVAGLR